MISAAGLEAKDSDVIDFTKRMPDPSDQIVPLKMQNPKMLNNLQDKRFPVKEWHGKFSPLGTKRAPISVEETNPKKMIKPETLKFDKVDLKMSSVNGRRAYVRNFDEIRENKMAPVTRDARVFELRKASRPLQEKGSKEPTMRDLNRFTFTRNTYKDEPVSVQKAGSGESN